MDWQGHIRREISGGVSIDFVHVFIHYRVLYNENGFILGWFELGKHPPKYAQSGTSSIEIAICLYACTE